VCCADGSVRTNVVTNGEGSCGIGVINGSSSRRIHWPSPAIAGFSIGSSALGGHPISGSVKLVLVGVIARSEPRSSFAACSPVSPVSAARFPFTHSIVVKTTAFRTWFFSSPNQETARSRSLIQGAIVGGFAITSGVTRTGAPSGTVPRCGSITIARWSASPAPYVPRSSSIPSARNASSATRGGGTSVKTVFLTPRVCPVAWRSAIFTW
jgi:hypothetical protein